MEITRKKLIKITFKTIKKVEEAEGVRLSNALRGKVLYAACTATCVSHAWVSDDGAYGCLAGTVLLNDGWRSTAIKLWVAALPDELEDPDSGLLFNIGLEFDRLLDKELGTCGLGPVRVIN